MFPFSHVSDQIDQKIHYCPKIEIFYWLHLVRKQYCLSLRGGQCFSPKKIPSCNIHYKWVFKIYLQYGGMLRTFVTFSFILSTGVILTSVLVQLGHLLKSSNNATVHNQLICWLLILPLLLWIFNIKSGQLLVCIYPSHSYKDLIWRSFT